MRILVSDTIEQTCIDTLKGEGFEADYKPGLSSDELKKIVGEYEALIVRSATKVTAEILRAATRMKVVGRAGTGVDNIDTAAATRSGILVMNTPGGNTVSAAEHTVSMMLALARNIPQANRSMLEGRWDRKKFVGTEVFEKTVGVVGLGKIGREVAVRAQGMGMKTIGFDPVLSKEVASRLNIEPVSLAELFRRADFITLHTPLTPETKNLLNKTTLGRCKRGVKIVNCARGGIIDETALVEALRSGQVGGAALDVFETEPPANQDLIQHEHVIATPHLGASTEEAQEKVAVQIARQVADALHGRGYAGVVNGGALHLTMKEEVRPLLVLAEKLGSIVAQAAHGTLKRITISAYGDHVVSSIELLRAGVLKGILSRVLQEPVNFINAPFLAEEMGISVSDEKEKDNENFSSLLRVRFETDRESKEVAGTVFGPSAIRLVKMDGFRLEVKPEGVLLIYSNIDKPGMLARVGTILAKYEVNIAGVSLGRTEIGKNALTVMSIDNNIPAKAWEELQSQQGISDLRVVHFEA